MQKEYRPNCQEFKSFHDAIHKTVKTTLDVIVMCLVHLSAEE